MKVSLITTVLNEEAAITEFIRSALAQDRPPDEIVIVDGGSEDRTRSIIQFSIDSGAPIKLFVMRGANRSQGRNAAIENATHDITAVTDVGCKLDKSWLQELIKPFETDERVDVVSGFYLPEAKTFFEAAVAAVTVPTIQEVNPATFLPSSRSVAFRKAAWERVGGYPEEASFNEDTPFDINLRRSGRRFRFAPRAIVYWRMRGDIFAVFDQFFRYAKGDGQFGIFSGIILKSIYIFWL